MDETTPLPPAMEERVKPEIQFDRVDGLLVPLCWLLGWLGADVLLMIGGDHMPGLQLCVLTMGYLGLAYWASRKHSPPRTAMLLFIPLGLLALCFALFDTDWLRAINMLGFIILAIVQALLLGKLTVYSWTRPRVILDAVIGLFTLPFIHMGKPFRSIGNIKSASWKAILKALLGFVIALPLFVVVLVLLSSSDGLFASVVLDTLEFFFDDVDAVWTCWTLILSFPLSMMFYSLLFSIRHPETIEYFAKEAKVPATDGKLSPAAALGALTPFAAVYALFVGIQATYLFGMRLPDEMTFADYARSGFFELFAVTVLNLAVVLLALQVTRTRADKAGFVLRVVCTIITAQTGLMLLSAVLRMFLYIQQYGLTTLRVVVLLCEAGAAVLLVALTLKIWKQGFGFFRWLACASLALLLIGNYMCMDAVIANYNVKAYTAGKIRFDMSYLVELSPIAALSLPEGSPYRLTLENYAADRCYDIRTWTLDDWLAKRK